MNKQTKEISIWKLQTTAQKPILQELVFTSDIFLATFSDITNAVDEKAIGKA